MNYQEKIYNMLTEVGKPEAQQTTAPQSWKGEGAKTRKLFNVPGKETVAAKIRLGITKPLKPKFNPSIPGNPGPEDTRTSTLASKTPERIRRRAEIHSSEGRPHGRGPIQKTY